MTVRCLELSTRYPQRVENKAYSPYCLCRYCGNHAFWTGLSAMSDKQILQRAKGRAMTEEQVKLIESLKLKVWNSWAKGEAS
jgi:hypothetical protein